MCLTMQNEADLVILENCKLDLLLLVLVLFRSRIILLLAFLGTAAQTKH